MWQQCILRHESTYFCSSLVKSELIWLPLAELRFEAKGYFSCIHVYRTTTQSLLTEIFAHCLYFQSNCAFISCPSLIVAYEKAHLIELDFFLVAFFCQCTNIYLFNKLSDRWSFSLSRVTSVSFLLVFVHYTATKIVLRRTDRGLPEVPGCV